MSLTSYGIIALFAAVYLAVAFEQFTRINKTAAVLFGAVLLWTAYLLEHAATRSQGIHLLEIQFEQTSEIVFFLLGAMTIVELIDSHHGFQVVIDSIRTQHKIKLVWIVGFVSFFLSAVLDNMTATIVMISLLRRLIQDREERWLYGSVVVIAANAGGAWTVIGDVTTTMLWIRERISTLSVMKQLFIPSLVALVIALVYATYVLRRKRVVEEARPPRPVPAPGARLSFLIGVGSLIFVPIFKGLTGAPPYMGILLGLSVLWIVTDLWHYGHQERDHLKIPHALTRIDISSILFFLGILLAVGVLDAAGVLEVLAHKLNTYIPSPGLIALLIGLSSAVIDNVPLVAAAMSMYDLTTFPLDDPFWNLVAFCAGTGGSILIIGSAAGIVFMGMERVPFLWYLRKISLIALLSYLGGAGTYWLLHL